MSPRMFLRPAPLLTVVLLFQLFLTTRVTLSHACVIVFLAFIQSVCYSLQSRAALRSSNLYHLIAALLSSFVFFATFRVLILANMDIGLLCPYMLGTTLGARYGITLSMNIEEKIGAIAHLGKEIKDQALGQVSILIGLGIILLLQFVFIQNHELSVILLIAFVAFANATMFSILRTARSTTSYWFHLGAVMLQSSADFFVYRTMFGGHMEWSFFAPYATSSAIGSIVGTGASKRFGEYIKTSCDGHVLQKTEVRFPLTQISIALLLWAFQFFSFGVTNMWSEVALFCIAIALNCAAAVMNRARQRSNLDFIAWSSVFSSGMSFTTIGILTGGNLAPHLILPYISGMAIGSLSGQMFAMKIEQMVGALMQVPHKN